MKVKKILTYEWTRTDGKPWGTAEEEHRFILEEVADEVIKEQIKDGYSGGVFSKTIKLDNMDEAVDYSGDWTLSEEVKTLVTTKTNSPSKLMGREGLSMHSSLKDFFISLAFELEPENLACDGERSRKEIKIALSSINAKWSALEKLLGRSVSVDEVWKWEEENRR